MFPSEEEDCGRALQRRTPSFNEIAEAFQKEDEGTVILEEYQHQSQKKSNGYPEDESPTERPFQRDEKDHSLPAGPAQHGSVVTPEVQILDEDDDDLQLALALSASLAEAKRGSVATYYRFTEEPEISADEQGLHGMGATGERAQKQDALVGATGSSASSSSSSSSSSSGILKSVCSSRRDGKTPAAATPRSTDRATSTKESDKNSKKEGAHSSGASGSKRSKESRCGTERSGASACSTRGACGSDARQRRISSHCKANHDKSSATKTTATRSGSSSSFSNTIRRHSGSGAGHDSSVTLSVRGSNCAASSVARKGNDAHEKTPDFAGEEVQQRSQDFFFRPHQPVSTAKLPDNPWCTWSSVTRQHHMLESCADHENLFCRNAFGEQRRERRERRRGLSTFDDNAEVSTPEDTDDDSMGQVPFASAMKRSSLEGEGAAPESGDIDRQVKHNCIGSSEQALSLSLCSASSSLPLPAFSAGTAEQQCTSLTSSRRNTSMLGSNTSDSGGGTSCGSGVGCNGPSNKEVMTSTNGNANRRWGTLFVASNASSTDMPKKQLKCGSLSIFPENASVPEGGIHFAGRRGGDDEKADCQKAPQEYFLLPDRHHCLQELSAVSTEETGAEEDLQWTQGLSASCRRHRHAETKAPGGERQREECVQGRQELHLQPRVLQQRGRDIRHHVHSSPSEQPSTGTPSTTVSPARFEGTSTAATSNDPEDENKEESVQVGDTRHRRSGEKKHQRKKAAKKGRRGHKKHKKRRRTSSSSEAPSEKEADKDQVVRYDTAPVLSDESEVPTTIPDDDDDDEETQLQVALAVSLSAVEQQTPHIPHWCSSLPVGPTRTCSSSTSSSRSTSCSSSTSSSSSNSSSSTSSSGSSSRIVKDITPFQASSCVMPSRQTMQEMGVLGTADITGTNDRSSSSGTSSTTSSTSTINTTTTTSGSSVGGSLKTNISRGDSTNITSCSSGSGSSSSSGTTSSGVSSSSSGTDRSSGTGNSSESGSGSSKCTSCTGNSGGRRSGSSCGSSSCFGFSSSNNNNTGSSMSLTNVDCQSDRRRRTSDSARDSSNSCGGDSGCESRRKRRSTRSSNNTCGDYSKSDGSSVSSGSTFDDSICTSENGQENVGDISQREAALPRADCKWEGARALAVNAGHDAVDLAGDASVLAIAPATRVQTLTGERYPLSPHADDSESNEGTASDVNGTTEKVFARDRASDTDCTADVSQGAPVTTEDNMLTVVDTTAANGVKGAAIAATAQSDANRVRANGPDMAAEDINAGKGTERPPSASAVAGQGTGAVVAPAKLQSTNIRPEESVYVPGSSDESSCLNDHSSDSDFEPERKKRRKNRRGHTVVGGADHPSVSKRRRMTSGALESSTGGSSSDTNTSTDDEVEVEENEQHINDTEESDEESIASQGRRRGRVKSRRKRERSRRQQRRKGGHQGVRCQAKQISQQVKQFSLNKSAEKNESINHQVTSSLVHGSDSSVEIEGTRGGSAAQSGQHHTKSALSCDASDASEEAAAAGKEAFKIDGLPRGVDGERSDISTENRTGPHSSVGGASASGVSSLASPKGRLLEARDGIRRILSATAAPVAGENSSAQAEADLYSDTAAIIQESSDNRVKQQRKVKVKHQHLEKAKADLSSDTDADTEEEEEEKEEEEEEGSDDSAEQQTKKMGKEKPQRRGRGGRKITASERKQNARSCAQQRQKVRDELRFVANEAAAAAVKLWKHDKLHNACLYIWAVLTQAISVPVQQASVAGGRADLRRTEGVQRFLKAIDEQRQDEQRQKQQPARNSKETEKDGNKIGVVATLLNSRAPAQDSLSHPLTVATVQRGQRGIIPQLQTQEHERHSAGQKNELFNTAEQRQQLPECEELPPPLPFVTLEQLGKTAAALGLASLNVEELLKMIATAAAAGGAASVENKQQSKDPPEQQVGPFTGKKGRNRKHEGLLCGDACSTYYNEALGKTTLSFEEFVAFFHHGLGLRVDSNGKVW